MSRDFSHITTPVMVYSPDGSYTIIERADLDAALAAGWLEEPKATATNVAPPASAETFEPGAKAEPDYSEEEDDLSGMSKADLLALAESLGVEANKKMTNAQIADAIEKAEAADKPTVNTILTAN